MNEKVDRFIGKTAEWVEIIFMILLLPMIAFFIYISL